MLTIWQDARLETLGDTILERLVYYVNYPFVNQAQFKVSLLSLLLMALVLIIAWVASRYARRFLERRLLRHMHLPDGLQYTLLRITNYLIMLMGVLYALKVGFSVDLTGVAVIAGFLAVGVGFGLQYIASDIVSGFILLFERPLRVGDRLKIDEIEGRVTDINLRATRIVTNDEITVIVPNSELTKNKIINWSYCERVRLRIPIGVAYGSDPQDVKQALIDAARSVEAVLAEPTPSVQFKEFGDSSLNFDLLAWINQPHRTPTIRSEINFAIDRVFRERDIEIPFPQRDLRLRSGALRIEGDRLHIKSDS